MIFKTFEEHTDAQLETAITIAAKYFESWRNKSFAERPTIVAKAASLMREQAENFANPVTLEMGKLIAESHGEVALSADTLDYYANNTESFLATEKLNLSSGEAEIVSNPLGVLFGVQLWNLPLLLTHPFCRSQYHGGQGRHGKARRLRAAVRPRLRKTVARCRCSRRVNTSVQPTL